MLPVVPATVPVTTVLGLDRAVLAKKLFLVVEAKSFFLFGSLICANESFSETCNLSSIGYRPRILSTKAGFFRLEGFAPKS